MSKRFAAILVLAVAISMTLGCMTVNLSFNRESIIGSGTSVQESRTVSGFDQVVLTGFGDVSISFGDTESLLVEADDNLLTYINTWVRGGVLYIETRPNVTLTANSPVRFELTVKSLEAAAISGSGNIEIANHNFDKLDLQISGSGNIHAAGTADSLETKVSGSGSIDCEDLQAKSVIVSIPGSGDVSVWAADSLDISISGSGNVEYYGKPTRFQERIQGSGSSKSLGEK